MHYLAPVSSFVRQDRPSSWAKFFVARLTSASSEPSWAFLASCPDQKPFKSRDACASAPSTLRDQHRDRAQDNNSVRSLPAFGYSSHSLHFLGQTGLTEIPFTLHASLSPLQPSLLQGARGARSSRNPRSPRSPLYHGSSPGAFSW